MFGTQPSYMRGPYDTPSFASDDEEDTPTPAMPGGPPSMPGVQPPQLGPQFNAPTIPVQGNGMFAGTPLPPRKPGFNEPGGWAEKLGHIGAILQAAGGSPAGIQAMHDFAMMQQNRADAATQRQQLLAKAQMERDAEARKINYSGGIFWRQGPDGRPVKVGDGEESPDGLDRALEGAGIKKGTPQYAAAMADRVGTLTNPIHQSMVLDPVTHMPMMVLSDRHGPVGNTGATGGAPNIPPEALDWLAKHPEDLPHFIAKYHVAPTQGGPAPQGPATFPGAR